MDGGCSWGGREGGVAYCELRAWHDFSTASVSKGANLRFRNLVSTKTIIWLPKTSPQTEYLCYLCGLSFKALHSALSTILESRRHSHRQYLHNVKLNDKCCGGGIARNGVTLALTALAPHHVPPSSGGGGICAFLQGGGRERMRGKVQRRHGAGICVCCLSPLIPPSLPPSFARATLTQ